MSIGRRQFISQCLKCSSAIAAASFADSSCLFSIIPNEANAGFPKATDLSHVKASYYKKLSEREVECTLCPRQCRVSPLERGYCGVRENDNGEYYTLVYSRPCSLNVDPIEKKPLFHFLPGTNAFSLATAGCNVNCKFCQNWNISQVRPEQVDNYNLSPSDIAKLAKNNLCPTIAYTYSEPVIFYEYMYDCAVNGHKEGIRSVAITGGYIQREPLIKLLKILDAVKIDLKAFIDSFYKEYVNGELKPVLDSIITIHDAGMWIELVYLVIPTLNDNPDDIKRMCSWITENLGADVPLHFTRFHPMYLMKNLPPTPVSTLEKLHNIAKHNGINFVYVGNVPGHKYEHTYCPDCQKIIIERRGYNLGEFHIIDGKCEYCHSLIPGVWS